MLSWWQKSLYDGTWNCIPRRLSKFWTRCRLLARFFTDCRPWVSFGQCESVLRHIFFKSCVAWHMNHKRNHSKKGSRVVILVCFTRWVCQYKPHSCLFFKVSFLKNLNQCIRTRPWEDYGLWHVFLFLSSFSGWLLSVWQKLCGKWDWNI